MNACFESSEPRRLDNRSRVALLDLSAAADMDSYDRIVKQQCPMLACNEADLPSDLKDDAELKSNIAVGVMVAGVATVAAGGVMLYLNRGRPVYGENLAPRVVPTTGGAALMLHGRF